MTGDTTLPLLASQREIWFAENRLDEGNAVYQVGEYVHIRGELDEKIFAESLHRVVLDLDAVHVRLVRDGENVGQIVGDGTSWSLRHLDLSATEDPPAAADAWMAEELARPSDLAVGPMFNFALLRTGSREYCWFQNYHHLVMDAYGSQLVSRRVAAVYTALKNDRDPGASPFGSLHSLVDEDVAYRNSPEFQRDRDFWRRQMQDRPARSRLLGTPTGNPGAFLRTSRWLPEEQFTALRDAARVARVPWPAVVTAAAALYLQRATGEQDVVLAFPLSARASRFARRTPATMANVVPLRLTVRPQMEAAALLKQAAGQIESAVRHQRYRGEDLQRDLGIPEPVALGPVLNIMSYAYDLEFGQASATMCNLSSGLVGNLVFAIWDRQDGNGLQIDVNGRPSTATCNELVSHRDRFAALLGAFTTAASSQQAVSTIGVPAQMASTGTIPDSASRAARTLPWYFGAQAARTPESPALTVGEEIWTYRELEERTNRIARFLIGQGIGPGDVAALSLPRSADLVCGILGVLKAGAAYLPLDPDSPVERTDFVLDDAAPELLITSLETDIAAPEVDHVVLDAPELVTRIDRCPSIPIQDDERDRLLRPDDPAYIIYTSGSTGRPKGVVTSHRNVVRLFDSARLWFGFSPDDVWTLFHSYAFDFSVWEMWGPLLHGGRLVIVPFAVSRSPRQFLRLLADERVTVLNQTPSAFYQLSAADREQPEVSERLCLRTVIFGGEALKPARLADWQRRHGGNGPTLINMYGITETTVHVTHAVLSPDGGSASMIGVPFPDLQVHVLDETLQEVPPGAVGEMYVAGPGLARGYLGRPALTAQRFTADPHGRPGERMYRTGDLARRDADGVLEFCGRADDQVKVRGFRIELGEIEAALTDCAGVRLAAVALTEDREDDQRLVGYIVPSPGATPNSEETRAAVRQRLPGYMVPTRIVQLDALPLTTNGKLNQDALPAPVDVSAVRSGRARTPRVDVLCSLFELVLDESEVGPDDDFFDRGGHSVLANALAARIRSVFSVEVGLRTIFDVPTPAGLATALDDAGLARPPLTSRERPAELEASYSQRRMWFLQQMDGHSATYNIPSVLRIEGPLDTSALTAAFGDVVARHESLRTIFPYTDGCLLQQVLPPFCPALRAKLVTTTELHERLDAGARRGFDLTAEPPVRIELFQTGSSTYVLLLVLHHIGADGASIVTISRDLARAYEARVAGAAPADEAPAIRYSDYTMWQNELLSADGGLMSDLLSVEVAYWRAQLNGLPDQLELPTDRPRPDVASYVGDYIEVELDPELHGELVELGRASSASLFMVLHAGLAALLMRLGAGEDIPVGSPVAGRLDESLDDVVGCFVNSLVLRTDLSGRPTFTELLERVRETALAAYAHQDVPFEYLVESLDPERSPSRHPLFQVVLGLQNTPPAGEFALPGLTVSTEMGRTGTAKFDLYFCLVERHTSDGSAAGIDGLLEYAADLFEPDTVRDLFARFTRLLAAAVADPDRPIDRLEVLSPDERTCVLERWNDTSTPLSQSTVCELFEQQVAAAPTAIAVSGEGTELTYAELDARANQMTREIVRRGVRTGDAVAVAMPRSADLVLAQLAVLKAGAAYLPIDARHPAAQVAAMLADSHPALLLTTSNADTTQLPADPPRMTVDTPETTAQLDSHQTVAPAGAGQARPHPLDAAYIMYTSGSTGRPKGIVVTHRDVVALGTDPRFDGGVCSVVLVHSPAAFDASTFEVWAPLLHGGHLIVAPPHDLDIHAYAELIEGHRPTALWLTAALFSLLAEYRPKCFAAVQQVWAGGEELAASVVRRVLDACPGVVVVNGYGPTETTTFATTHLMDRLDPGARSVPIGTPLANMRTYVLDAALRPMPPGVPGELYIAGAGVARGYLGNPAMTAKRFVADPHGTPGERMYRSGDLARWTTHGVLEYCGRTDRQVKLRGFRVELGAIESVLVAHPAVAQAVAVACQDEQPRVIVYVVPSEGEHPAPEFLQDFAARHIPRYMLPNNVVVVGALPLNVHGKVDRSALPSPISDHIGRAPADRREALVRDLVARSLGMEAVDVDDDFFALGGDSITSIRLVSDARQVGLGISVQDVFECRTVAGLSTVATELDTAAEAPVRDGTGTVPASPVMCWVRERDAAVDKFAQSLLLSCPAGLRWEPLIAAVRAVVDQHDSLRSRLVDADGAWSLVIEPPGSRPADELVQRIDVTDLSESALAGEAAAAVTDAAAQLEPRAGVMARFIWFDTGPDTPGRLLAVIHHFAVDGVSWRILVPDLVQAYAAASAGREMRFPPVGTTLRQWAENLTDQAGHPDRLAELPHWIDVLEPPDPLLTEEPVDPRRDFVTEAVEVEETLSERVVEPLLTLVPATFHCGVDDLLLTALALAVASWRRERQGKEAPEPILVDVEGHGRDNDVVPGTDITRTLGWFTTIHPVRLEPGSGGWPEVTSNGSHIGTAVKQVKDQADAAPDNGLGFGLLRYLAPGCREVLARLGSPQIGFNYLGRFAGPSAPIGTDPGWAMAPESIMAATADPSLPVAHSLELNVLVRDGDGHSGPHLTATWTGASRLWEREELGQLCARWSTALQRMVAHTAEPDAGGHSRSDFPLAELSQTDIDDLETAWRAL